MNNVRTHNRPYLTWLLITAVSVLLVAAAWMGWNIHALSNEQKHYKEDYAFVNNAAYGLFSVDTWRDQLVGAAKEEVRDFRLTPEQRKELRAEILQVLRAMVDHTFSIINRKQHSLRGKLRKFVVNTFVNRDKIDAAVPGLADKLMEEVTKPATYRKLSAAADSALSQLGRQAYDSIVAANSKVMDSVYSLHGVHDRASFDRQTATRLQEIKTHTYRYAWTMLGCVTLILLAWVLARKRTDLYKPLFLLSVAAAAVLLAVGVSSTMIEIDARIAKMELHFLDRSISFEDQGLFFQSKSIVDVVSLLMDTPRIDSKGVGILIFIFSILFPFLKLGAASTIMVSRGRFTENRVVRWFAFESGKWSMADVMVVAILMTFIGFNGIVTSELEAGNYRDLPITSISTSNTSVQPGYIIFIAFVLYSLVLSTILAVISRGKKQADQGAKSA